MPYFKNNDVNILLVHIPKTGGTSLELYFSKKYEIPLDNDSIFNFLDNTKKIENNIKLNSSLQHITYETMIKYNYFFNINFDNIKIITIVRNPYERIISDLFFFKKINKNTSKEEILDIIKTYLKATNLDNHNLPQYMFIIDNKKELIPNLHILHTNTLNSDMEKLGYNDFNLHEHLNKLKVNYYDYLNNDSIKLINDFYDNDFTLFNYTKILSG